MKSPPQLLAALLAGDGQGQALLLQKLLEQAVKALAILLLDDGCDVCCLQDVGIAAADNRFGQDECDDSSARPDSSSQRGISSRAGAFSMLSRARQKQTCL